MSPVATDVPKRAHSAVNSWREVRNAINVLNQRIDELIPGAPGVTAPDDPAYLLENYSDGSFGLLPNRRRLVAGTNISLTDAGAGSTLTVAATGVATNSFLTWRPNTGGDIEADSPTDLAILAGGAGIATVGTPASDTITINMDVNAADFDFAAGVLNLEDRVLKAITTDTGVLSIASHAISVLGGAGMDVTHAGTTITAALADSVTGVLDYFNGTIMESFDARVTSDGATVTMSLEQSGGGDLTMVFSDGHTTLDCTPAQTISLTAGSTTSPQVNFIYIPQSTKVLTKSTSGFPNNTTEHIRIGFFFCASAAETQTSGGAFINQNHNDHAQAASGMGHGAMIGQRIRVEGSIYFSGVDGNGTTDYLTITAGNVEFITAAGVVFQMHSHTVPVFDTSAGDEMHVKNWSGDANHGLTNLHDITADSTGAAIGNNKYFNLTFWGVANKAGEHQAFFINLPSGFYNTQSDAENDVSGYDDFTMPREYTIDSSTGFLVARMTLRMGATWVHQSTVDLRGQTPQTAAGGAGAIVSSFADNVFNVYDNTDNTKVLDIDVGANVSTGTTRTITMADRNIDLSDGGTYIEASHFAVADFTAAAGSVELADDVLKAITTDSGSLTIAAHAISILGGSNATVTHTGTTITVASTNTTYTAGEGLSLSGTTFNLDFSAITTPETIIEPGDLCAFWDITATAIMKRITFANFEFTLSHDNLSEFVANEHIDWTDTSENFKTSGTVDLDGVTQVDATLTVGVDDTGHDVKFFGATSGNFMLWDESADSLLVSTDTKVAFRSLGGATIHSPSAGVMHYTVSGLGAEHVWLISTTEMMSAGSTGMIFNEAGNIALDVRMESNNNTHMFFLDAGAETIGVNKSAPDTNASMEFGGIKPLLLPRLTTVQRDAVTSANGMIIYNTDNNVLEGYENGAWVNL